MPPGIPAMARSFAALYAGRRRLAQSSEALQIARRSSQFAILRGGLPSREKTESAVLSSTYGHVVISGTVLAK
jgi:hypothetical protein